MTLVFAKRLVLTGMAIGLAAWPQSRAQPLEFEVAAIKLVKGPVVMHAVNLFINHGRFPYRRGPSEPDRRTGI